MKLLTLLLSLTFLFFNCSSFSFSTSDNLTFQNGILTVQIEDGPAVDFRLTSDGMLEISSGEAPEDLQDYWYSPEFSDESPVKTGSGTWSWGAYTIQGGETGWMISKDGRMLTASSWGDYGWEFYSGEDVNFYGMGGVDFSPILDNTIFTVFHRSEYSNHTFLHIPVIYSSDGDGMFFQDRILDEYSFGPKGSGTFSLRASTEIEDYFRTYFFHNPDPKELVQEYYSITGDRPLLPRWAYGFIQSRYGYRNQEEVLEVVNEFQEREIPLDGIILDLYWFRAMGDLSFDLDNWNPSELDSFLEERDIKLITITEPYYREDSVYFLEWEDKDYFLQDSNDDTMMWSSWWTFGPKEGSLLDLWQPGVEDDLGAVYQEMDEIGIDAFWTDLGEPEEIGKPDSYDANNPPFFGENNAYLLKNFYNQRWSRIIYEALREKNPQERVFILSRSGNWKSPQYGVSVWSGDIQTNWYSLSQQPGMGLASGLTGLPYWGSDVGGFLSRGLPDPELFIRWMQFGAWSPVFRPHGAQSPREPFIYEDETANERMAAAVHLRSRIHPYVYSLAYQSAKEGIPMMQPLFFEYADWEGAWTFDGSYLFGDKVFVHPVVEPKGEAPEIEYTLPPGQWLDFNTGELLLGGDHTKANELDWMPVYLAQGAIIPMEGELGYEILLHPGEEASTFYWLRDDGESDEYLQETPPGIQLTLESQRLLANNNGEDLEITLMIPKGFQGDFLGWEGSQTHWSKVVSLVGGENTIEF